MSSSEELLILSKALNDKADQLKEINLHLSKLEYAAKKTADASSGSWLGYQSRVYYRGFQTPLPGERFSMAYGLQNDWAIEDISDTSGDWVEYPYNDVIRHIYSIADNPDHDAILKESLKVAEFFQDTQETIRSIIIHQLKIWQDDSFLKDLLGKIEKLEIFNERQYVAAMQPSGQLLSSDLSAVEKGIMTPPHIAVIAKISAMRCPYTVCYGLAKFARNAGSHIARLADKMKADDRIGTNVFIGHGQSRLWKDLKDFVQDRLKLPWDEFNHIPVAGMTNIARLSQMLDNAALAFIIMTAEDEQNDGKKHARMNVIHEVGLFQGRLGFTKAIVLLEEGCEEFSNIQGLGQIRFRAGDIATAFEAIRMVAEREGLIQERS